MEQLKEVEHNVGNTLSLITKFYDLFLTAKTAEEALQIGQYSVAIKVCLCGLSLFNKSNAKTIADLRLNYMENNQALPEGHEFTYKISNWLKDTLERVEKLCMESFLEWIEKYRFPFPSTFYCLL